MIRNNLSIRLLLTIIPFVLIGCMSKEGYPVEYDPDSLGMPRLVVSGTVVDTANTPLPDIYVSIFGVREPGETDIITYNYAVTDSVGQYTIIRYRGRELPMEVTVVATDSTGVYQQQLLFAPVTYDTIQTNNGNIPYNAYVTADFVLSQQNSQ